MIKDTKQKVKSKASTGLLKRQQNSLMGGASGKPSHRIAEV
jgi:hypothetical protein